VTGINCSENLRVDDFNESHKVGKVEVEKEFIKFEGRSQPACSLKRSGASQ
jgi:hypothetical protein